MSSFLALDPGVTFGWACLNRGSFRSGQFPEQDFDVPLSRLILNYGVEHIVVEDWTRRTPHGTGALDPHMRHQLASIASYAATLCIPLTRQRPADKRFASGDKLRKLGWWAKGRPHANDAARHLLHFLILRPEGEHIREALVDED